MEITLYQVDAFTDKVFGGNPAAICPLESWLDDDLMQQIAAENNLAETAFFVPEGDGFRLRWFTPAAEVDLCGHATLATAQVLFQYLDYDKPEIAFETRSGTLTVKKDGDKLLMDFPADVPQPEPSHPAINALLGVAPEALLKSNMYYMAVYPSQQDILKLQPDFRSMMNLDRNGLVVTAPGDDSDFVSRFFAPKLGIDEDPVTGSAHCVLTPYWAERLHKTNLHAFQLSPRGGELWLGYHNGRVQLSGRAATYMQGYITV